MSATEQIWFIVGIAGFLFILEGTFNYVVQTILKGKGNVNLLKVAAGLFLFVLSLIVLFNLPNN